MRFFALGLASSLSLLGAQARAELCRPPAPGSWHDPRVEALYDSASDRVAAAQRLEGAERRAEAARGEALLRELETRIPCLPSAVVLLARALELQGRYLAAVEQYARLLDARPELERYRFYAPALASAESGLTAARGQTGTLTIHVKQRDCALGGLHAFLDDADAKLEDRVRVDPGPHALRIEALGCAPLTRHVDARSGSDALLAVDLRPATPPKPSNDRGSTKWLGLPPWVVMSTGAVLALGASVGGYLLLRPRAEPVAPLHNCRAETGADACTSLY